MEHRERSAAIKYNKGKMHSSSYAPLVKQTLSPRPEARQRLGRCGDTPALTCQRLWERRPRGTHTPGLSIPGYWSEKQTGLRALPHLSPPPPHGLEAHGTGLWTSETNGLEKVPINLNFSSMSHMWTNVLALPIPRIFLFLKDWYNNIILIKTI